MNSLILSLAFASIIQFYKINEFSLQVDLRGVYLVCHDIAPSPNRGLTYATEPMNCDTDRLLTSKAYVSLWVEYNSAQEAQSSKDLALSVCDSNSIVRESNVRSFSYECTVPSDSRVEILYFHQSRETEIGLRKNYYAKLSMLSKDSNNKKHMMDRIDIR